MNNNSEITFQVYLGDLTHTHKPRKVIKPQTTISKACIINCVCGW